MKYLIASLLVAATAAGCGDNRGTGPDAAPTSDASTSTDGATPGDAPADASPVACETPIRLPLDPQAEARARAALTTLAPNATLEWNAARGTAQRIDELTIELTGCTGSDDLFAHVFDALEATPDLFQIARAEWHPDAPVTCGQVSTLESIQVIRRVAYGSLPLNIDVFSFSVQRVGNAVVLRPFGGTYVPKADPTVLARLAACTDLADEPLRTALRAQRFGYFVFQAPPAPGCLPEGPAEYTAADDDTLTLGDDEALQWDETELNGVIFRRTRHATLRVAPANITPELIRSDANCPGDDLEPRVGWIRWFDAITGEILGDKPNPEPFCIVC